jgi:RHS repeat-associated protein
MGLRASKAVNGTSEGYVWNLAEGMPTIIEDGGTRYITGPDGLPIEQVDGSGATAYYLQDQLGSTRGLTDSTGQVVEQATYDAYGKVKGQSGSVSTPFGYAGQYTDSESGLQYLRARCYDPSTEQFMTADPLAATTQQPYSYAGSNPANAVDPMGLDPQSACGCPGSGGPSGGSLLGEVWSVLFHNAGLVSAVLGTLALVLLAYSSEGLVAVIAAVVGAAALIFDLLALYQDFKHGRWPQVVADVVALIPSIKALTLFFRALATSGRVAELGEAAGEAIRDGDLDELQRVIKKQAGENNVARAQGAASELWTAISAGVGDAASALGLAC